MEILSKGSVINTTVEGKNVYITIGDITVKVGTITKKNWSWLGIEEVEDGNIDLAVLDYTPKNYIIFTRKHLTCRREVLAKLSTDQLFDFIDSLPNNKV